MYNSVRIGKDIGKVVIVLVPPRGYPLCPQKVFLDDYQSCEVLALSDIDARDQPSTLMR